MNTGERIRQARIRAGLTQKQLANKVGVQFSAIHKYESGMIKNLKRETIAALAEALDVKPSWLMCLDDENSEVREKLLRAFDQLDPAQQEMLAAYAETALSLRKGQDTH